MAPATRYALIWTAVWALGMASIVGACLWLTDGLLIFTLDDPFIHLAVAEEILQGGYGVNHGEVSSPSSSILFPFLLAMTEWLGLGPWGALLWNLVPMALAVWGLLDLAWRSTHEETAQTDGALVHLMAPFLLLSMSALALPMTGMEHSLHILCVVWIVRGLAHESLHGVVLPSLLVATAAMPLVRFEGFALAAGVWHLLVFRGHWRAGLLCAVVSLVLVGFYFATMHELGLPLLPSSVLTKSDVASAAVGDMTILGATLKAVQMVSEAIVKERWGLLFAVCIAVVITAMGTGMWSRKRNGDLEIACVLLLALAAHLVAGRYGWFARYEVYAVTLAVAVMIHLFRTPLRRAVAQPVSRVSVLALAVPAIVMAPYVVSTARTPIAARGTYEQQYLMHRFAHDLLGRNVAVNDLGLVSYRNERYVLDLYGLGSEEVRALRAAQRLDAPTLERLVRARDIPVAMVYRSWFDEIPRQWCLLAVLESQRVTAAVGEVQIYLVDAAQRDSVVSALDQFARDLPARVKLRRNECPAVSQPDVPI